MRDCINFVGAGGHAAVLGEIAQENGFHPCRYFEFWPGSGLSELSQSGSPCDHKDSYSENWVIAMGDNELRRESHLSILESHPSAKFPTLLSLSSYISNSAEIGEGTVVMPKAVVNAGAQVGVFVIVNSSSVIEHHATIGDFSHCAPGSVVLGAASIGFMGFVGAGSVIGPGSALPAKSVLAALSFLKTSPLKSGLYAGSPAVLKNHTDECGGHEYKS